MTEIKYSDDLLPCYIPLQGQSSVKAFPGKAFTQGDMLTDKSAGNQPFRAVAGFSPICHQDPELQQPGGEEWVK